MRAKATTKPTAAHLRHPRVRSSIPADGSAGKHHAQGLSLTVQEECTMSADVRHQPSGSDKSACAWRRPWPCWVNTETHVYHKEGSHFYGTTKKGKYITETEAVEEG